LEVAKANEKRLGLEQRIRFLRGDLLAPVEGEKFEFVISNPPYVADADREMLAVEVRDYEPDLALFAGSNGLDVYRRLTPLAYDALVPGGFALFEIGYGQAASVAELFAATGFSEIGFTKDLQGIDRVIAGRR
jgi:release factor glutamine methyltransferase